MNNNMMIYWHTMLRMHGEKEEPKHKPVGGEKQGGSEPEQNTCYRQDSYFGEVKTAINIMLYQHKILR